MTRASLLRILDHVNGISDDEIRELEQLAAAFPYCQTAHVLLAKTAHDRGSMLAGQRLRRAATYAADRELLRQLLERPAPAALPTDALSELAADPEIDLFAVEGIPAPAPADETASHGFPVPAEAPVNAQDTTVAATPPPDSELAARETATEPAEYTPVASFETVLPELPATKIPADAEQPASVAEPTDLAEPLATPFAATKAAEATHASAETTEETAVAEKAIAAEPADEQLPAAALPIRPPTDAGLSRFEFGLGEARLPEPTSYRLPGLDNDEDEFAAEDDELPTTRSATPPRITAPFRADAELGYALGGGSRLGYDLQSRTPDGFALDLPLEAFFEPDALLLAHARAHQPAAKTSSLDLINRFLKAQPRIKAGTAGLPLPTAEQTDLSVRSSVPAPALASESLARIMVRQGKTAKAIEIYEHLMAKQPGKMAYFAEQIQQLQQPPE